MSNGTWSLDGLYLGFDDPKYAEDFAALQQECADFVALAGTIDTMEPMQLLKSYLEGIEGLTKRSAKLSQFAMLRKSANTKDAEAASWGGRVANVMSSVAGARAAFSGAIAKLENLDELIDSDESLEKYAFYLRNIRDDSKYLMGAKEEEIFSRMSTSGHDAWSSLQSQLTATMKVAYNGGVTNLPSIRNMAYEADPAVRKAAYEAELAAYPQVADAVAFSLNSIKQQTLTECALRGYDGPLDKTLKTSRMTRPTLDALLEAMQAYLPKYWQYLRRKAEVLGHENGLPWYDLFAPMGSAGETYTIEEAKDFLLEQFGKFDDSLKDMVARAFDENWIDFYPRPGKVGGAFCAPVMSLRQSRVLTNYDGSFSDIVTVAHELGHAYHNEQIFDKSLLTRYTMPVAETASTFNECLVMKAAIAATDDKQRKLALIESRLQDSTQIICDIYSRYLFETSVFEARPKQFMGAADLCDKMVAAQKAAYGDGLDHNVLHPYMWVNKSHYYGGTSFYNFPYAFGGLFAGGLYALYREEGKSFIPRYQEMLGKTLTASVEDTAKVMGIDLTKRDFWEQALADIADEIDQFLELTAE